MYSDEQQSTRSPATSRTDSYRDGPGLRTNNERAYQLRSTANKENGTEDNEYEETPGDDDEPARNELPPPRSEDQYIAALRYRFPSRPKTDYAYSKPLGPSSMLILNIFQNKSYLLFKSSSSTNTTYTIYYSTNTRIRNNNNNNNAKNWTLSNIFETN